jgi:hypothetical protein
VCPFFLIRPWFRHFSAAENKPEFDTSEVEETSAREEGSPPMKRYCLLCTSEFVPSVPHQRYCCKQHRYADYYRRKYGSAKKHLPRVAKDKKEGLPRVAKDKKEGLPRVAKDIATQEVPSIPPSNLVSEYLRRLRKQGQ